MAAPTQSTKRSAPESDSPNSPQRSIKRTRRFAFNSLEIKKMGYNFEIPAAITKVRSKLDQPHHVGMALGVMLYYITPLISTHLENAVDYRNKAPEALTWASGFVEAIDQYIAYLRLTDACSEKFPNDLAVDRKGRRPRRKYVERYTYLIETAYKPYVREQLADAFQSWSKEQTQLFNKGIDKALSGIQWCVYPDSNVVIIAGDDGWAIWLRGQCEEMGMLEARAGREGAGGDVDLE
jgi:hypothetical protein